jgi:ABC-type amino acid transport system permease subunit
METQLVRFLVWGIAVGVTWLSALAILDAIKGNRSESKTALWIAFIACTPVLGPVVFWLFGQSARSKDELVAKEALLKARFNATSGGRE